MSAYPARGGKGLLVAIRTQLREATSDVLTSALEQLESGGPTLRANGRPGRSRRAQVPLDRTREILERDRALRDAAPDDTPSVSSPAEHHPEDRAPDDTKRPGLPNGRTAPALPTLEEAERACQEPIRTRTMAKLLAAQGEAERAMSIYRYLVAREGTDPGLDAEIHALVASLAHAQAQPT